MDGTQWLQLFVLGIALGSIYALIALGYSMVYGVLRLINFAHGDIIMVGAFVGYFVAKAPVVETLPLPLRFAIVFAAAMLACAALGVTIERCAYRPIRHQPRLTALITAIGVSLFLEYGGQVILGATPRQDLPAWLTAQTPLLRLGAVQLTDKQLLVLGGSLALLALMRFIVFNTLLGKAMRAIAQDITAAYLVGINVNRVIAMTFAIGSALAAAAGVMLAMSYPKIDPLMGLMPGIKAFVAAVLGGIGDLPGAVLGGFVLGLAETFVGYFASGLRDAVAFAVLILILLFKPTGLLGKGMVEKV
ncbi:High-affinity branched-chain amino acid transport system permease protein LivH [bacterium HR17]|uniref:High-affinity branched-chain amino acid transport system permease protein LivH n=1 Tax=Candidatus Fervidibacter japonicus TaxID=2035412 RepID=A0A2H5XCG9_9BACT|nr:High-affinity branched-chain amino acid transport system permease protein LivH [bacterium HR17]